MEISQNEKEKLYRGFELFKDTFTNYIVSLLKRRVSGNWRNEFIKSLSPQQLASWEKREREGRKPENLIDFQHFKYFAIKNKEHLREDFKEKTVSLPTLLEEIVEVRNKYSHFEPIDEDEAAKAWINMRKIARLMNLNELEQEIRTLEKGEAKNELQNINNQRTSPVSQVKTEVTLSRQTFTPSNETPSEILDIVNCANPEFRKTVFAHNVYLCPAKGGAYKHKQCKYLGIYWNKKVGAVAEIEAVIDVQSENQANIYFLNGNKNVAEYITRAKEKALLLRPNHLPIRVFLLKELYPTDFIKDSSGGMFGSKIYLNVEALNPINAEDLSQKLQEKTYSELGL